MDIIVTIPAKKNWEDYQRELEAVKNINDGKVLNFKVSGIPQQTKVGEKCWVTHKGFIKGYMIITGFAKDSFKCEISGIEWKGKFIQRSGEFKYVKGILPYKGFQGFRYFSLDTYNLRRKAQE